MDSTTGLVGVIASLFALTTAMLAAQQKSQGVVVQVLQAALKTCQEEKTACFAENKATVEKSYGLVGAFNDLKVVAMKMAENQVTMLDKMSTLERRVDGRN